MTYADYLAQQQLDAKLDLLIPQVQTATVEIRMMKASSERKAGYVKRNVDGMALAAQIEAEFNKSRYGKG